MKHDPARWLRDYQAHGYLVVEDLVAPALLHRMREELERITAAPTALPDYLQRHLTYERDYTRRKPGLTEKTDAEMGDAIKLIMELPLFAPVFRDLILYEPLLEVLQTLFGSPEFHFHNYKCIVKAPYVSSKFVWHRDLPYLNHSTPNLITAMLCLDEMTAENGATVVLPGTHRIPEEQCVPEDADIPEAKLPAEVPRVTVACPAGSAVLFHVNLIHGGGANRSPRPRRNVIGIWAGPETYPIKANRYAYQDLYPRSEHAARQRQTRLTFPEYFAHGEAPGRA